jgi:hypothetical protein
MGQQPMAQCVAVTSHHYYLNQLTQKTINQGGKMNNLIHKKLGLALISGCLMMWVGIAQAAPLVVFSNGGVADADDVNANFNELGARIETISQTPGADGTNGTNGAAGADGNDGAAGAAGTNGIAGAAGNDGAAGAAGTNGIAGVDGTSCTVAQGEGFANISCGSGTMASVYDGNTTTGNTPGDMQYWTGSEWVVVPAPTDTTVESTLRFVNAKPTWGYSYYQIGDRGPAGGFVFYVTDGGLHGLEAAPVDQSTGTWGCDGDDVSGAVDTDIGTGAQNTDAIVSSECNGGSPDAALAATGYELNGYSDWFLPSKDELNLMWTNLADSDGDSSNPGPADPNNVGGFAINYYWSSSQSSDGLAWYQYFDDGIQVGSAIKDNTLRVRAVRAF